MQTLSTSFIITCFNSQVASLILSQTNKHPVTCADAEAGHRSPDDVVAVIVVTGDAVIVVTGDADFVAMTGDVGDIAMTGDVETLL